ncbi:MAG: aminotransferase class I/II-fold pyridoxal phosphate-dependent enzyme [Fuerstiella sp.]|nr:aminotransferase class I/II-fold pyridoxal phosphate-dependent enzyme [Fuerstiella sp.]
MPVCISPWARQLKSSPTLEVKAVADRLRADGVPVLDLGIGEMNPEIPVPSLIKQAMVDALDSDATHYSGERGDPELVSAISEDLARFGLSYSDQQIVVCPGPKDAIFKVALTILNSTVRRRRLLMFTPGYESFENIPVLVTGDPPIVLPTDSNFLPDPSKLDELLKTNDTIAAVVLNSPNNPTGAVYKKPLLRDLAAVLSQHKDVAVISDEVYRTIYYDDVEYASIASLLPEQTFIVSGMSKEVSGTGLRLGFVAGPKKHIGTLAVVEGNASSCVNLPTQRGYARFLRADGDFTERHSIRDQLCVRRDHLLSRFAEVAPRAKWNRPQGAFYFFPDMTAYIGQQDADGHVIENDLDLSRHILETRHVVTIPGTLFQRPGHIRFAFAQSIETIDRAMEHLGEALALLRP